MQYLTLPVSEDVSIIILAKSGQFLWRFECNISTREQAAATETPIMTIPELSAMRQPSATVIQLTVP